MNCPTCGSSRTYERGRGEGFIRYRCQDCTSEFDKSILNDNPSTTLGPCSVCGEMTYVDDGEDMSSTDEPRYEHFDCGEG